LALSAGTTLQLIRLIHTLAWAFFAGAILAMPVAVVQQRFALFAILAAVVALEVLVLAVNGQRCPLTPLAARYTTDRQDNFDICLPLLIARYNKQIFGSLYLASLVFGLVSWLVR